MEMFVSLAISAGVIKGLCDLPYYTEILNNSLDSTVRPLYCSSSLDTELKNFFEFAVDMAFAVDPPANTFATTLLSRPTPKF